MKLRDATPERLTLEDRPWITGIMIGGFTLILVGLGLGFILQGDLTGGLLMAGVGGGLGFLAFWAFVRRTIVFLDRAARVVLIREASLFGQTERRHPLSTVRRATVETSRSSKGGSTHRPALEMSDGSVLPLRTVYISGRGAHDVAAQVNEWLALEGATDGAAGRTGETA